MTVYNKFAEVYDDLMKDMPYSDWIAFAKAAWSCYGEPKTVVDLGCGTGNISIPLAINGYEVTGIDLSENMLAVAQARYDEAQSNFSTPIQFLQQDMRKWSLDQQVDSVISFCDCINYLLEEEEVEETFRRTYAQLKPGGTFLFDVHSFLQFESYRDEQPFTLNEEGVAYIWTCDYDDEINKILHNLTIFKQEEDGRYSKFHEQHEQRAYHPERLEAQLKAAGFKEVHIFSDFTLEPPDELTARLFYVAIK